MTACEKAAEQRWRRLAAKYGLRLMKSRRRDPDAADAGYQLVDAQSGLPVYANWALGCGFGLDLDDVGSWLSEAPTVAASAPAEPVAVLTRQNSNRPVDDALVAVGSFAGVCVTSGLIVIADRAVHAQAVQCGRDNRVVALRAASDHRDRGAKAAVLGIKNGVALLGNAPWLDADSREALNRLHQERRAVDVAVVNRGEVTLQVPTPSGAWWRLPAVACRRRALAIEATPVSGCEEVVEVIDGAPAFTMQEQLVGFIRVVHLPPPGQPFVIVLRPCLERGGYLGPWRIGGRRRPGAGA